jgi:hypothetical protein
MRKKVAAYFNVIRAERPRKWYLPYFWVRCSLKNSVTCVVNRTILTFSISFPNSTNPESENRLVPRSVVKICNINSISYSLGLNKYMNSRRRNASVHQSLSMFINESVSFCVHVFSGYKCFPFAKIHNSDPYNRIYCYTYYNLSTIYFCLL